MKVKDITLIAIFSVILFVQEEILNFIPNVNLTFFLIVLYSKTLGLKRTTLIIFIYCLLDNFVMNSFSIYFTPCIFTALILIPILINTIFKNINGKLKLSFLSALFSLMYCWSFIVPSILIYKIDFLSYIITDIPFEILLATSSFISVLLLYDSCSNTIHKLLLK